MKFMIRCIALLLVVSTIVAQLKFSEVEFAGTNQLKHQALYPEFVEIDGKSYSGTYNVLFRSNDVATDGTTMGQQLSYDLSSPIYEIGEDQCKNTSELAISHSPDFSSILKVGDSLFMVVHFEAPYPSVMYLVELEQDENGVLTANEWKPVDWSAYEGLWVPCAGSVTPWGSHLGSEEYEPDAKLVDASVVPTFEEYLELSQGFEYRKVATYMRTYDIYPCELTLEDLSMFKPYYYGYPTEVTVFEDGNYTAVKHMAMGRTAIELAYVMPDQKTAYITDDGTNVMLSMFIAETAGDLSAGTLYAGKFTQVDDEGAGRFDIEWIPMGYATDDELFAVAATTKFSDIFDYITPNVTEYPENGCPEEYTSVNTQMGHECLILKEGQEVLASRFETRRYAAMLGATTEFSKWEGITFDPTRNVLYTAMSENRYGMEDNQRKGEDNNRYDIGGPNHVRVEYNPCGCVYSMEVDESYQVTTMYGLLCGIPDVNNTNEDNSCIIDGIANPDNVAYISGHDGLLIGEDTGSGHQNDVVWYYDLKTGEMTRMFSTPYGSETTSPYWYGNINGHSYIVTVIQHPYGESDEDRVNDPESTGEEGWVGYFGPFPAVAEA